MTISPRLISSAPRAHLLFGSVPTTTTIAFPQSYIRNAIRYSFSSSSSKFSSTSKPTSASSSNFPSSSFPHFASGPSPHRLPKEEQEIYEALQRQSTGAFSTPRQRQAAPPQIKQSSNASSAESRDAETVIEDRRQNLQGKSASTPKSESTSDSPSVLLEERIIEAQGKGEELHPNVRRGAEPEFEGEVNPKTREVGGPKNEPLRWGAGGEWSYNGRTTDF